jgi:hypothetical protein
MIFIVICILAKDSWLVFIYACLEIFILLKQIATFYSRFILLCYFVILHFKPGNRISLLYLSEAH